MVKVTALVCIDEETLVRQPFGGLSEVSSDTASVKALAFARHVFDLVFWGDEGLQINFYVTETTDI